MTSSRLIERLQALRFTAAALVLVGHVIMEALQHPVILANAQINPETSPVLSALRLVPWGVGVDIFFVISGFIISYGSLDRPASTESFVDFLIRRIIRIWPTYAFFTVLMVVANLLFQAVIRNPSLDPVYIVASLFFIPWERPTDGRMFPLLGQGWTLNYEMFFYVCFALAILLPRRARIPALVGGGCLLIVAGLTLPLPSILAFYANPIIAEFLFGVLLGVAFRKWPAAPRTGAVMVALGTLLAYGLFNVSSDLPRIVEAGVPAALIVAGILFAGEHGERLLGRPSLVLLGNASYALYLSHPFVINALIVIWLKLGIGQPVLFFLMAIVCSTVASVVVYLVLERRVLDHLGRAHARFRSRNRMAIAS